MNAEFEKAIELGLETVENGGEISRAEETVERLCRNAGATDIQVFIIPSLISVSAKFGGEVITATKRIYRTDLDLGRLEEINDRSRRLCGEKSVEKSINTNYPTAITILCIFIATGAFCVYFGGNFADALFSGIAGTLITYIPYDRAEFNIFSKTLIESTAAGLISFIPSLLGMETHPDKIMIGTIMLLIPGMSIGSAMKDMMSGNPIAGILQLTEAVIVAFAIVLGFAVAIIIFGSDALA